MKGIVTKINRRRGMVVVKTEEGYSVFEVMGFDEVNLGDEVWWKEDTVLDDAQLTNITNDEKFEVYFQNHHVTESCIDGQLRI